MNVESIIKREGITVLKALPTLQVNLFAKNIAEKLCNAFPEHNLNQQLIFTNIARLNMYIAKFPNSSSRAKYVSGNCSIYFSEDVSLDNINDVVIHECIHFLQEKKNSIGNLYKLGLSDFGSSVSGMALNEAAVQLMASEANSNPADLVTYFNISIKTNSPTYYTLECALLKQMSYFTGTYPLYNSTLASNDLFKNTFIAKSSKNTFYVIQRNLDRIVYLEDLLFALTNDLIASNNGTKKVGQIHNSISNKKQQIFNLFLKTQNIIMTSCFNYEFKHIRTIEELIKFKDRLYKYQNIIGITDGYTFYNDFYSYTMNKFSEKYSYLEKHQYVPLGSANETALALFENKPSVFDFIKKFINKFKKLNGLKQEELKKEHSGF